MTWLGQSLRGIDPYGGPSGSRNRQDPVECKAWGPGRGYHARTLAVGNYSGLALRDGLVPPPVARANEDDHEPTLFPVEGGTAVVVDFSSPPTRGFFPANIRHYRKE
jgi:hypothetical protein